MRLIRCVGAVITRDSGELLLVKRGREPEAGRWSLPGGRVEAGESDQVALVREVREETGLMVRAGQLVGSVRRPGPGGVTFDIWDYTAFVTGGELVAGDDAADVRWAGDLTTLALTTGLAGVLIQWGVSPPNSMRP